MHALVYLLHITQIGTMYILTLWSGIIVHGRLVLQRVIWLQVSLPVYQIFTFSKNCLLKMQ